MKTFNAALLIAASAGIVLISVEATAQSGTVKVTPLGSHDGEFCRFDRAIVFEDPDGTRLLYDAGRTVAGADDPRLGEIDAVLVSHVHGDHLGDRRIPEVNAGECSDDPRQRNAALLCGESRGAGRRSEVGVAGALLVASVRSAVSLSPRCRPCTPTALAAPSSRASSVNI